MPPLIRLYITQVAIGFGIAAVMVALLLWFDVAGLGHLVSTSDQGLVAALMLWVFHGIVFGGVQFAWAIMSMAEKDEDDGPRGGMPVPLAALVPVRNEDPRDRHRP